jgi:hypothetical protein
MTDICIFSNFAKSLGVRTAQCIAFISSASIGKIPSNLVRGAEATILHKLGLGRFHREQMLHNTLFYTRIAGASYIGTGYGLYLMFKMLLR